MYLTGICTTSGAICLPKTQHWIAHALPSALPSFPKFGGCLRNLSPIAQMYICRYLHISSFHLRGDGSKEKEHHSSLTGPLKQQGPGSRQSITQKSFTTLRTGSQIRLLPTNHVHFEPSYVTKA